LQAFAYIPRIIYFGFMYSHAAFTVQPISFLVTPYLDFHPKPGGVAHSASAAIEPQPKMEEVMKRQSLRTQLAIAALAVGVALASVPAFAQSAGGPGGQNYGAGSNPQNGGANYQSTTGAQQKPLYNTTHQQGQATTAAAPSGPAGPGGQNYGAGSNPQNGK
jgi:hypothetical protein